MVLFWIKTNHGSVSLCENILLDGPEQVREVPADHFQKWKKKNNHSIVCEEKQTYYLIQICSSEFIDSIEDDDNNHLSRYQSIADKGGCSSHR